MVSERHAAAKLGNQIHGMLSKQREQTCPDESRWYNLDCQPVQVEQTGGKDLLSVTAQVPFVRVPVALLAWVVLLPRVWPGTNVPGLRAGGELRSFPPSV